MSILAGRAATTRGVLLRVREQLDFVQRGKELLEMKRDHLASEINKLLSKLKERQDIDKRIMEIYDELKAVYSTQGYSSVASQAASVKGIDVKTRPISIMGVVVPDLLIDKEPEINYIPNLSTYHVASQLKNIINPLLEISVVETKIEILAYELMLTNRKVNALTKVLIPGILELIRYIEGKLEEEMLEEFSRNKHLKKILEKSI